MLQLVRNIRYSPETHDSLLNSVRSSMLYENQRGNTNVKLSRQQDIFYNREAFRQSNTPCTFGIRLPPCARNKLRILFFSRG
jgi:hypothetical protein